MLANHRRGVARARHAWFWLPRRRHTFTSDPRAGQKRLRHDVLTGCARGASLAPADSLLEQDNAVLARDLLMRMSKCTVAAKCLLTAPARGCYVTADQGPGTAAQARCASCLRRHHGWVRTVLCM